MKTNHRTFYAFKTLLMGALFAALIALGCGSSGTAVNNGDDDEDLNFETEKVETDKTESEVNADGENGKVLITIPSDTLSFGSVQYLQTKTMDLTIKNNSKTETISVNLIDIVQTPTSDGKNKFELSEAFTAFQLKAGYEAYINIKYTRYDDKDDRATLEIASDAANAPIIRVSLRAERKGTSELKILTPCLNGDTDCIGNYKPLTIDAEGRAAFAVGNTPANTQLESEVLLCNMPETVEENNKTINIAGFVMTTSGGQALFDVTPAKTPSADDPFVISPTATPSPDVCLKAAVIYHPPAPTYGNTHKITMRIDHNADAPSIKVVSLDMEGTASRSALDIQPSPIDFGKVPLNPNPPPAVDVTISNPTAAEVKITKIAVAGVNMPFTWEFTNGETFPVTLGGMESVAFKVYFAPTRTGEIATKLVISTNIPGSSDILVDITGIGRQPNQKPVAKIARAKAQADIIMPIVTNTCSGVNCDTLAFFGDISYDPDRDDWNSNGIKAYHWKFESVQNSNLQVWCNCDPSSHPPAGCQNGYYNPGEIECNAPIINFTTGIDVAGRYILSLVVEDLDGTRSDSKSVTIQTYGSDAITIEMNFTCKGTRMDADLQWIAPNGSMCSPATMNGQRTCSFGNYGSPVVSEYTNGCGVGHTEAITHESAGDGTYRVKVLFVENCYWDLPLSLPIPIECLAPEDTDITLKFYVNGIFKSDWTRTANMSNKGDTKEWTIVKSNGAFMAPSN